MYKSLVLLCVVFCVIDARPWQNLEPRDGYIPVYIRPGDTPLEEINLGLAEAFHELSAGRSAGKHLDASPESPDPNEEPQADQPRPDPETPEESAVDHRPYEKKTLERKLKKANELSDPVERR